MKGSKQIELLNIGINFSNSGNHKCFINNFMQLPWVEGRLGSPDVHTSFGLKDV